MSEPKKDCGNWVRFVKTGASGLARAITGLRGDLTSSLANLPLRLCGLFRPLALAKSHAGAATVLVNEFDTSDLERTSYDLKGSSTRLTGPSLKLVHCYDAHARAGPVPAGSMQLSKDNAQEANEAMRNDPRSVRKTTHCGEFLTFI